MGFLLLTAIVIAVFVILSGLRIVNQYERGIILTLGKYTGTRCPPHIINSGYGSTTGWMHYN